MADSIGAVGGSQIDVNSLASQLVAAERAPLDTQIQRAAAKVTTQISAVGTLMGALSAFRSALSSLKTVDVFSTRQATSAVPEIFTATATASAVPGSYEIEVEQLAQAHQIASQAFASGGTQVIGTGTLTLSLGGESFSVTIDDTNSTLAGIRDAINKSADNPGVRATLIQSTDGARLVLTSAATGEANGIEVAQSGGDGGLSALAYTAAAPNSYTQLAAAQDAIVRIATFETRSATNTVTGAIDGVTLNLLAGSENETVTLTVGYDSAAVTNRIKSFVTAYNALEAQLSKLGSYDSTTKTSGAMLGDSLLTGIESQLRRVLSTPVTANSGAYQTLASIGITTQADGSLALDETKLQSSLSGNFDAVARLFGSENGVAAKLFAQVDERLKTGGAIDARSKNLVEQQKDLQERQDTVDARMQTALQRYIRQFTALDTLLSSLQTTSSYLTQQLDQLSALSKSAVQK